jgi:hypothetical protein
VPKRLRAKDGDRAKKQFQFLNEISARAIRIQLGRRCWKTVNRHQKNIYENKIAARLGGPKERPYAVCIPLSENERGRQQRQPSVDGSPRTMGSAPPPLATSSVAASCPKRAITATSPREPLGAPFQPFVAIIWPNYLKALLFFDRTLLNSHGFLRAWRVGSCGVCGDCA